MNKVYKVIWSELKHCYVVVSELAKNHGKGGPAAGRSVCCGVSVLVTMMLASLLTAGYTVPVWAEGSASVTGAAGTSGTTDTLATIQGGEGITVTEEGAVITVSAEEDETLKFLKKYLQYSVDYNDPEASGAAVDPRSDTSIALGKNAKVTVLVDANKSVDNVAIGNNAQIFAGESGKNTGKDTAIGSGAVTGNKDIYTTQATAIGADAKVFGSSGVSIGGGAQVGSTKKIGTDSNNNGIYAYANQSIAIGQSAKAYSDKSTAIGGSSEAGVLPTKTDYSSRQNAETAKMSQATAVGYLAKAKNANSTSIGALARATGKNSTATGVEAKAAGENSTALGAYTTATGIQNVAMGEGSQARKDETIAVGFHTIAFNAEDIAVGHDTLTFGDSALGIGHLALTAMPVREIIKNEGTKYEGKYIDLPRVGSQPSQINGSSRLCFQTSDGTVLLYESSVNTEGVETGTYYKVKAVEDSKFGWKFVKVDAEGNEATNNSLAVKYRAVESKMNKDVRPSGSPVNHIDCFIKLDNKGKDIVGTETEPLDGGIAIGSYTVAQGEHSMAFGLTTAAYGKNSIAQGLYADAFGEGAIAFGHETVSGARVNIIQDENLKDVYRTEFTVSNAGIAERTLADGSIVGVDKNNVYSVSGGGSAVEINSIGTILTVDGEAFGYDKNNIKLASDPGISVTRDDVTGYYYCIKDGKKQQVSMNEELLFTGSGNKSVTIAAGKMTLASGGISLGSYAHAEGDKALAIGRVAGAYGRDSAAVGRYANAFGEGAVALGHNAVTGAQVTDDGNGYMILELSNGTGIPVAKSGSETGELVKGGVAIGSYAHALGDRAVSIGLNAGAFGDNSAVIGPNTTANGKNAVAIGSGSDVGGENSIAIGTGHTVSGANSGAFGDPTTISGDNSYSVGNNNEIAADSVFALGNSITTVTGNSVFLADEAAYVEKGDSTGGLEEVKKATVKGADYGNFAGASPVGVVSVGAIGKERRIQNVAAGLISAGSTDAINGSQLYAAIEAMQFDIVAGDNITVTKETINGTITYTVSSSNATAVKPGDNVTVEGPRETTDSSGGGDGTSGGAGSHAGSGTAASVDNGTYKTDNYVVNAADSKVSGVTVDSGKPTTSGITTTTEYTVTVMSDEQKVVDGKIETEEVHKSDTFTVTDTNTTYKGSQSVEAGDVAGEGSTTFEIIDNSDDKSVGSMTIKAGENITITRDGDAAVINAKASKNVKVIEGKHTTVTPGEDGDLITYAVNVITDGKVVSGDTGIVTGDTVYNETRVTKDGNYIKKDNTAAENITALDEQVKTNADNIENINNQFNNTYNQMNRLDDRMRKGLAGAAALAALHPMDFDPDDKLTFAAGVGNYRGENAAALGAFYRPDEKVMFSIGGTFGNSDNMVNAGVSFSLDRVNRVSNSRTAMAHEIVELRDHIAKQDARIAKQDEQIAKLTELVNRLTGPEAQLKDTVMFPDVPENHWAYEYLEDLQKRGVIEGYPNGLFMGDRSMTRYEYAAVLDRALRKGVSLDARAAGEFKPELDYIREQSRVRVDRIAGQNTDRYKIERVRVNNEDVKNTDIYGSKVMTEAPQKR